MRKLVCLTIAALLAAIVVVTGTPHALAETGGSGSPTTWEDLTGAKVALITGAPFEDLVRKKIPEVSEVLYFGTTPDTIVALQTGKVDAIVNSEAVGTLIDNRHADVTLFPELLDEYDIGIAFPKGSEWHGRFAAITDRMRSDGTAEELWKKWVGNDEEAKTVPDQTWPATNGTLKVVSCQSIEPVSYRGESQMLGFDVEVLLTAAKELEVHLEFEPMEFAEMLAFIQSGKADIGCGSILITPERAAAMDFATTHNNNLVLLVRSEAATAANGTTGKLELSTPAEVVGKRIGMFTGANQDRLLTTAYEGISDEDFSYFNSTADLVAALKANKIDAFVADQPICQLAVSRNDGIAVMQEPLVRDNYGYALAKGSPLTARFNECIARMRADGTIDEICQKWTSADESAKVLPEQDWEAPAGTLVVGAIVETEPECYLSGSTPVGFCVEILLNIARDLGYHLEFNVVSPPSFIAEIDTGRIDVACSCLSITEERKQTVDMTDSFYDGGVAAVVRTTGNDTTMKTDFLTSVAESFRRTFIVENRWQLILSGLGVTVLLTLLSGAFGTAVGFLSVLARRSGNRVADTLVGTFEGLMGRLPIVVVLMVFYYVIFGSLDLSGVAVATVVFTLAVAASTGAIMWNSVRSIDVGQSEASLALGFNERQTFFGVILPQAARQFMPLLSGQLVSLTKDTAVVGYIAVQDLTRASDLIRSRTMEAFFPLISTAIIYFILCCLLAAVMGLIIKRLDVKRRPRTIKGVEL